jgi:hypothetical protein
VGGPFDVARHVEFRGERVGKIIRFCGKMFRKQEKYFRERYVKSSINN